MTVYAQKTLSLEYGGDFVLTQNGSLQMVSDWDLARQGIERVLLTNPAFTLADGSKVAADYIYAPGYGIGARRLVGQPSTEDLQQRLTGMITQAVNSASGVDVSQPPQITLKKVNDYLYVVIEVFLNNGKSGILGVAVS